MMMMAPSPTTTGPTGTAALPRSRGRTLVRAALGGWSLKIAATAPAGALGWRMLPVVGTPSPRHTTTSAARPVTLSSLARRNEETKLPASNDDGASVGVTPTNDGAAGAPSLTSASCEGRPSSRNFNTRRAIVAAAMGLSWAPSWLLSQPSVAWAESAEGEPSRTSASAGPDPLVDFANRNRNGNRDALIREDYWYMLGRIPPRLLTGPITGANDPQWNAFGSCRTLNDPGTATGPNPCTYVSLNLRIPAYNKYASSISYGARQYGRLGDVLRTLRRAIEESNGGPDALRREALELLMPTSTSSGGSSASASFPSPIVDAELKLVLFATALTTSPNFPQPSRELLIARYYANEIHFAHHELLAMLMSGSGTDAGREMDLWEYGRDSWNSYFQIVNQHVTAKVGDPFELLG